MDNREKTPLLDEIPRGITPRPLWRQNAMTSGQPESFEENSTPTGTIGNLIKTLTKSLTSSTTSTSTSSSTSEFSEDDSSSDSLEHVDMFDDVDSCTEEEEEQAQRVQFFFKTLIFALITIVITYLVVQYMFLPVLEPVTDSVTEPLFSSNDLTDSIIDNICWFGQGGNCPIPSD